MQTCTMCRIKVKVGTGGPKNFEIRLASKKHLMNAKATNNASKPSRSNLISNFFEKQRVSPSLYQAPPAPRLLSPVETPHLPPAGPSDVIDIRHEFHFQVPVEVTRQLLTLSYLICVPCPRVSPTLYLLDKNPNLLRHFLVIHETQSWLAKIHGKVSLILP